ncbi:MAG: GNVR domain-containing protein [Thermodesulfobacteriota bacterium]|nr:GNVR domain-containing protein [Thermodesulfobacteriota bacterium]
MINTEKPLGLHDYVAIGLRRKWYIILPLVCSVIISFGVYKYLPKVYKATTLILVQPQSVPESYVRPTVTATVMDRLNTISQEILSRTRLEKVIQEFNLYADLRKKAPMETVVAKMGTAIEVNIARGIQSRQAQNAFSISYEGAEPRTVMMVTNKLASLFIEENLKVRELQAEGTSQFIIKELSGIEEQLIKKEEEVRRFRQKHMGQLPQQLDANLRILERLQQQLKTTSDGIRAAEDRTIILQGQIEQLKKPEPLPAPTEPTAPAPAEASREVPESIEVLQRPRIPEDPIVMQWNQLKRDLESAQAKYTHSHPDVISLKRRIANIEPNAMEILKKQEATIEAIMEGQRQELNARRERASRALSERPTGTPIPPTQAVNPITERLLAQYSEQYNVALLEAKRMREEEKELKKQIHHYQTRIEETPKREQELLLLSRDYDLLKTNYQSLMDKKIQSQMAENLERKQQGEQFKILDPARLPEKPIKPDRDRILLIGAFIGLMSGLGLAWFRESLDQSFHSEADLEAHLGLPILAVVPNLKEEKVS